MEPEDFVRLAKLCEQLGYHSVWGNDHITTQDYVRELFPGKPPNFYELLTVLSFCAAATTTLKVGTALAVLPMRDPFWLAKQAATIDQLSGGRFILGVGIGAYREEFAAWAPRLKKGAARRDARRGPGADAAAVRGAERHARRQILRVRDIEMCPKPKQKPFALWIGGHNMETSSAPRASAPAGCRAGGRGPSSPSASRCSRTAPRRSAATRRRSRSRRNSR